MRQCAVILGEECLSKKGKEQKSNSDKQEVQHMMYWQWFVENITRTVNVKSKSTDNRGKWMIDKRRLPPHIITLPPSKTCTTSTRLESLWVSVVENDTTAGVLREGTVGDDMSWVIAKGIVSVWTVTGEMMQLAIDEDRRCRSRMRAQRRKLKQGARSAGVTTGCVGITSGSLVVTREVPK